MNSQPSVRESWGEAAAKLRNESDRKIWIRFAISTSLTVLVVIFILYEADVLPRQVVNILGEGLIRDLSDFVEDVAKFFSDTFFEVGGDLFGLISKLVGITILLIGGGYWFIFGPMTLVMSSRELLRRLFSHR